MTARRQLYFYWRVAIANRDAALAAVRAWQHERMLDTTGLQATLLLRTEAAQDRATVMEVYARAWPPGIGAALEADLAAQGDRISAPWRQGERKLEAFEPIS